jgi:very-short-patch-repair endonuclease
MYYGASPKLFEYARSMRFELATEAEKALWILLTTSYLTKYKFRRQHPISTFIADFYSHQLKLVIEIDGGYHLSKEQKEYDNFRDEDMSALGITVLRFTNKQVSNDINTVLLIINNQINKQGG